MSNPNPYQTPAGVPPQSAPPQIPAQAKPKTYGVNGQQLVITHRAVLPGVCVKTGTPAHEKLKKEFMWAPPWLILTVLASPVIYVILFLIMRKKMTIELPLSAEYAAKRKRNVMISNIMIIVCLIITIAGIYLTVTDRRINDTMSVIYGSSILVGFLGMLIFAVVKSSVGAVLKPTKIDDQWGWFNGAHPDFLRQIEGK